MSTGIAVKRMPNNADFFKRSENITPPSNLNISPSSSLASESHNDTENVVKPIQKAVIEKPKVQVEKLITEADLERRLREALRERDDQWRKHEKAQIVFLQSEGANMLKALHLEIDKLGHQLRDAKRQLFVSSTGGLSASTDLSNYDHSELTKRFKEQELRIAELEQLLSEKEAYAKGIERKVMATMEKLQEQINLQGDRIRQLTTELNDRNQTVAHLSSQLRTFRLREAMAQAQQRRRASQGSANSSPLVSPSSPHRIFPPKGLLSASVTVTYPGNNAHQMRSLSCAGTESASYDSADSIEKPSRRRSSSGLNRKLTN
ncbi:hypothetical protein WR25_23416 [Diploscapter pachys]|uniref:CCDC92/74 N-terminal domain-containing protein n=1 Tax=Diploscapter pachys TaxID=2018661 RepID=A0A2A2JM75_9BILA|nr:hypothetical protein WR25_23416 [Diploscapter pachys]